jgi:hypothetical protein
VFLDVNRKQDDQSQKWARMSQRRLNALCEADQDSKEGNSGYIEKGKTEG